MVEILTKEKSDIVNAFVDKIGAKNPAFEYHYWIGVTFNVIYFKYWHEAYIYEVK